MRYVDRPMAYFIDTGAWVAFLNTRDQYHKAARAFSRALTGSVQLVTHRIVISETYEHLRRRPGRHVAMHFLAAVEEMKTTRRLHIYDGSDFNWSAVEEILAAYGELDLSYCDAASSYICRAKGLTDIFGFDGHFLAMGLILHPALPKK